MRRLEVPMMCTYKNPMQNSVKALLRPLYLPGATSSLRRQSRGACSRLGDAAALSPAARGAPRRGGPGRRALPDAARRGPRPADGTREVTRRGVRGPTRVRAGFRFRCPGDE